MGLYHDTKTKKIVQSDLALDMKDPTRYFRHEPIFENKSGKCIQLDKESTEGEESESNNLE